MEPGNGGTLELKIQPGAFYRVDSCSKSERNGMSDRYLYRYHGSVTWSKVRKEGAPRVQKLPQFSDAYSICLIFLHWWFLEHYTLDSPLSLRESLPTFTSPAKSSLTLPLASRTLATWQYSCALSTENTESRLAGGVAKMASDVTTCTIQDCCLLLRRG